MEQCVAILTQILARQADNENQGVTIQKRIRNIVPFRGEPGTLVSFIGTIDGVRLRSHFRPAKEWAVISKEITNIKVFTISQLVDKIQGIVNNVTECAAFSAESVEMANCLNSMLVVRIKELVAGSLAREISDLYSLESIRAVLYKYIGYDAYNLKKDRTSQNNYQHTHRQEKVKRFYNQRTDIVGGNIRRDDRQCYENQFGRRHNVSVNVRSGQPRFEFRNRSGQEGQDVGDRSRQQRVEQNRSGQSRAVPMDVDAFSRETNQLEGEFFYKLASDKRKIFVVLTFGSDDFCAMIDTGSTISLLNSSKVPSSLYEKILLGQSVKINTIQGVVLKDTEQVKTKCPIQFGQPDNARIRWTKIALDKEYDFLIGMDWLEKNVVSLDLMNQELVLKNDRKIPFVSKSMEEVIVLLILMTTTTQAGLLTTSIDEQLGYLKLKVKTVQIVNETNTILHVINPEEILKTIVEIRVNLKHLDIENRNIIDREIDTVVAKTKSIMPYRKIQENFHSKRGGVTYNPNEPDTHLHRPINNIAEQVNIPDIPGKSQQIPLTPITANNTKSTVFANLAEIANKYSM
ncbi:unnamed protein product [Hermetia illucens]|uniref:Uncharacterized protein n=1 Tax=Hermetia illucens TaxID=343691 RepID=A0A7R8YLU5_HERIL|nr:unnamed protein product [Hermetia illucens]